MPFGGLPKDMRKCYTTRIMTLVGHFLITAISEFLIAVTCLVILPILWATKDAPKKRFAPVLCLT